MPYFILWPDRAVSGPFPARQLLLMEQNGKLTSDCHAAAEGDSGWTPLPELAAAIREDSAAATAADAPSDEDRRQIEKLKQLAREQTQPVLVRLLEEDGYLKR